MTLRSQKYAGKFSRKDLPTSISYYEKQGIKLKGGGAWRDAICPFHADTKPSLRVNIEKGAYRCMVCGARGGDVLAFHMHLHSMPFIAACQALGAWIGG
jgi:DNA primase